LDEGNKVEFVKYECGCIGIRNTPNGNYLIEACDLPDSYGDSHTSNIGFIKNDRNFNEKNCRPLNKEEFERIISRFNQYVTMGERWDYLKDALRPIVSEGIEEWRSIPIKPHEDVSPSHEDDINAVRASINFIT
jgi:hypothetical protein